jgi:hypothetical protein
MVTGQECLASVESLDNRVRAEHAPYVPCFISVFSLRSLRPLRFKLQAQKFLAQGG